VRQVSKAVAIVLLAARPLTAKDPDVGSPKTTLQSYVAAVKAGDYEAAKKCWVVDGKDRDGALEGVVGFWTASRRAELAMVERFGREGINVLGKFAREDLSDDALDRTLSRIQDSEAEVKADQASFKIKWKDGDGSRNEAFLFSREPLKFRKVEGKWLLDASAQAGGDAQSILEPGTWGPLFRDYTRMLNEVSDALAAGKLKTKEDVSRLVEEKSKAAAKRYEDALGEKTIKPPKRP
jgi:hypothetical protein